MNPGNMQNYIGVHRVHRMKTISLFETDRRTLKDSIELTIASLVAYANKYQHWAIAFSGGKDSSAMVTLVAHLIETNQIPTPKSLTVIYADTRMELPPLQISAIRIMDNMKIKGIDCRIVLPDLDKRFFVYMLGRGVPPPSNTFRWCTGQIKIEPMQKFLRRLRDIYGEKFLMLTGVRIGESAVRDQKIALSCGRNGAECGQGWFQETTSKQVADTLAPLLHWRVCHVWDWLMFNAPALGFPTSTIALAYGGEEAQEINARTGCVGCNLASRDVALDQILKLDDWQYLRPFKRLKPLYAELKLARNRLRKDGTERRKDGTMVKNPMRLGPLTFDARHYGLEQILSIQSEINAFADGTRRPFVSLINTEEKERIEELITLQTWPQGWIGDEVTGDVMLPEVLGEGIVQEWLFTD